LLSTGVETVFLPFELNIRHVPANEIKFYDVIFFHYGKIKLLRVCSPSTNLQSWQFREWACLGCQSWWTMLLIGCPISIG